MSIMNSLDLKFQSQMFDEGPSKSSYIDSSRMVEFSEDIKGALAHSSKMRKSLMNSGSYSGQVGATFYYYFF